MTGSLEESHYEVVKEQQSSDQLLLSSYTESESPTTIAITAERSKATEYCDEQMPALALPDKHRARYHKYRAAFRTNSAIDNPEARAAAEARLDHWYQRHLQTSDEAQKALAELVSRLSDGEDITLVGSEKSPEAAQRANLKQVIEARLSSKFDFTVEKREPVRA